jgi:hypothetical protein
VTAWLDGLLLAVFLVHLVVFAVLGLRRGQSYYIALVVTFSLLSASAAFRLWGGDREVADLSLAQWLRYAAWAAALVSITWTGLRIRRRLQAGRQNCS